MAMSILPKFLNLKWNISRTIWRNEVGDGSFFSIFHSLSFELNFFFDRRFPLNGIDLPSKLATLPAYEILLRLDNLPRLNDFDLDENLMHSVDSK